MVESVNHGALEMLLCFKFPFGFVSDIEFMKEKQRGTLEKLEHANIWHFCWKTHNYKKWMQIKAKNNEQHMGNLFSCYKALISFGHLTSVKKIKLKEEREPTPQLQHQGMRWKKSTRSSCIVHFAFWFHDFFYFLFLSSYILLFYSNA